MSVQVEKLEKNMVKLTVEVGADKVADAIKRVYNKQKNQINVQGFRKGKAPLAMVEKLYGPEIFYEDAANMLMQENYPAAVDESGLDIVSRPTITDVQIEKGKPFVFTAEAAVRPEVTLGQYKGVEVAKVDATVTDEDVDAEINKEAEKNSREVVVERAAEMGDITTIDFEGFVDGVAFEGGKGQDYRLELGSGSFIPGFEEQIVGKSAGDEFDINVTFPEDYAEDLAAKDAVFKIVLHEVKVKEMPEIDDEFAADVSDFETLEEYKADVRAKLTEQKERRAKNAKTDEAIDIIAASSEMEIPDAMIDFQCEQMIDEFAQRIAGQGLSIQQYYEFSGSDEDKLKEQVRPDAISRIKASLVLDAIVKAEGLEATDEDVDAEIEKMAAQYGMEADKLKEYVGEEEKASMKKDLAIQKAADFIADNAVEVEKAEEKEEA